MSKLLLTRRSAGVADAPPPDPEWAPNLPAWADGGTLMTDTTFGNMLSSEQVNAAGLATTTDTDNTIGSINSGDSGPWASTSYRTVYPAGSNGEGVGGTTLFGYENREWRRMYFAIAVKLDANYRMHATGGEKFWYPRLNGGSSCMLNWHIQGAQTATGTTWCFYLDPQVGGERRYQTTTVYPVKGEWNLIEVEMHMDTPGNSNGVLRVWVNGDAAIAWTDVNYSNSGTQDSFDGIVFNGVRGGPDDSGSVPAGGMSRHYNRLAFYASTSGA
jgi:hypothetical protein